MAKSNKHQRPQPRAVQKPKAETVEYAFPAPTAEFRCHHDTLKPEISRGSFRPNWSVTSRFMGLEPREGGGEDEAKRWKDIVSAATWWRNTWDIAAGIRQGRSMERVDCDGPTHDGISQAQLDAIRTRDAAARHLGPRYASALVYSLVMDMPWTDMAIRFGCHHETARKLVRQALDALVKVYDRLAAKAQPEWES